MKMNDGPEKGKNFWQLREEIVSQPIGEPVIEETDDDGTEDEEE